MKTLFAHLPKAMGACVELTELTRVGHHRTTLISCVRKLGINPNQYV